MQECTTSKNKHCSTPVVEVPSSVEPSHNLSRRRFLTRSALGMTCLGFAGAVAAATSTASRTVSLTIGQSAQQVVPWFDGGDRHVLSVNVTQPSEISLHQYIGSFSAQTATLRLDPAVVQLLQSSALPANPRLHSAQNRYWLTFSSGSSVSSMQGYIAVADSVNSVFRLERVKPLVAANELSLFNNSDGQMHLLASDGKMLSMATFNPVSQRSSKWLAITLSNTTAIQLTSPVLTKTTSGYEITCLNRDNQLVKLQAQSLSSRWHAQALSTVTELTAESQQMLRIAYDQHHQIWSGTQSSELYAARIQLTPFTSVYRA
ncbi:hypothetical protein QX776_08275 [Alteromonadaceae bacterium BrNp21-10]|nr:hypothetical protein [Alteromonadaceae bacterium BrNp21-10]